MILDDDEDLRESMVEIVETCSAYACLGVSSYAEMVQRRDQVLRSCLAIIDINLGADRPSGIDAYRWLRREGYGGRIVFLTGHAPSHPLVVQAKDLGDARVLEKPVLIDVLDDLLGGDA